MTLKGQDVSNATRPLYPPAKRETCVQVWDNEQKQSRLFCMSGGNHSFEGHYVTWARDYADWYGAKTLKSFFCDDKPAGMERIYPCATKSNKENKCVCP